MPRQQLKITKTSFPDRTVTREDKKVSFFKTQKRISGRHEKFPTYLKYYGPRDTTSTFPEGPLFRGDEAVEEYLDTLQNIECEEDFRRTEAIKLYRQAYKIKGDLDDFDFFKFGDGPGGPGGDSQPLTGPAKDSKGLYKGTFEGKEIKSCLKGRSLKLQIKSSHQD